MNQLNISNLIHVPHSYNIITFILFAGFMVVKIFLLYIMDKYRQKTENATPLFLLSISIASYLVGEVAILFLLFNDDFIVHTLWRIAWNIQPLQFYTQILFAHSLVQQRYKIQQKDKLFLSIFFVFIFFPLLLLFITPNNNNIIMDHFLDIFCRVGIVKRFLIKIFGYLFLIFTLRAIWKETSIAPAIPHILRLQLKAFFILMCIPLLPDGISLFGEMFQNQPLFTFNTFILLDLFSVMLFTTSLLFFARRIYHLRFLNLTERVIAGPTSRLTNEQLLETKHALCMAKTLFELPSIHATFFYQLAHIEPDRITFHLAKPQKPNTINPIGQAIEQFIHDQPKLASQFFVEDSLLVYDELAFTSFYEQSKNTVAILEFMDQINASVFITLKQQDQFFGAIVIAKNTHKELFPRATQIQMQLYGTFVTYALEQFEQVAHRTLLEEHKKVSLELFKTNQKNARFHESLASIVKPDSLKRHGIVLYKNAVFSSINPATEELLQINPNLHHGHPLSKALKELVRRVTQYGTPHTIIEKNIAGQDICCKGFPYKKDELVILVSPADVTDTLHLEHTILNPADVDYTIFLHATQAGHVINQALPGNGNIIQNAKVHMLKTLLSKKAMLLTVQDDDIDMMLTIAQNVCRKSVIRTVDCSSDARHDTISALLFGKQRFTSTEIVSDHGLLYTFDESGIIHIKNAHRLEIQTQQLVLQFLKTGFFCLYRSESQHTSNATIIMSSHEDLELRAKQGLFSQELYDYLKNAIITLPNLTTLPFAELDTLARSFQKQLVLAAEYHHVFGLTSQEQETLDSKRPLSYHELHRIISSWIKQRMTQSEAIQEMTLYTPKTQVHDATLLNAARLGKQTLKDRKLMLALWEKFQNQSKIAQLLNVDRSSVHRRLKEYGIGEG